MIDTILISIVTLLIGFIIGVMLEESTQTTRDIMRPRGFTGVFDINGNMIKEGSIVSDGYLKWQIVWEDAAFKIRQLGETATSPFTEDMVDTLDLFVVPTAKTNDRNQKGI